MEFSHLKIQNTQEDVKITAVYNFIFGFRISVSSSHSLSPTQPKSSAIIHTQLNEDEHHSI